MRCYLAVTLILRGNIFSCNIGVNNITTISSNNTGVITINNNTGRNNVGVIISSSDMWGLHNPCL